MADDGIRILAPTDGCLVQHRPARRVAAVVLRGARVAGLLEDLADVPAGARVDSVEGCAVPGFTDAHVHFPSWALGLRELDLLDARTAAEVVARVAQRVRTTSPAGWLRGRGWREELWPAGDPPPNRGMLDAVCPDVPVALRAHDGHSLWVNTAAIAAAERQGASLERPGGVVERDTDGEPTGILREESAWALFDRFAAASFDETLDAMRAALPVAAAAGVVAVHDKDGGRGAAELFAALQDEGQLTLRVWQSLPATDIARAARLRDATRGSSRFRVGYVKAFMDGTLGSRTARLLDGTGVEITSAAQLADIIREAAAHDLPVAVHAIGDQANRDALDAFEATHELVAGRDLRHRIEHAQCVAPADLGRFAVLGVCASVQYTHATSDRDLVERLWADRLDHAYPCASLHRAGALLAGGSDAPVEPLSPLDGLRAAVDRTTDDRPGWRLQEALDRDTALHSFTAAPAWLEYGEQSRGRLAPGLAADVVVLSADPTSAELAGLQVVATMIDGEWLLGGPGASGRAEPA